MRIVFAGTPDFAAEALRKLIESEHEVVLVLSQPDRPSGRGRKLKASEVKQTALSAGIKVLTPLTLRRSKGLEETAEAIEAMKAADADVLVVAAYGLIIPQEVLD
ncbi:formyltransferase family protein, partial [uncultured Parasutterella sp.]